MSSGKHHVFDTGILVLRRTCSVFWVYFSYIKQITCKTNQTEKHEHTTLTLQHADVLTQKPKIDELQYSTVQYAGYNFKQEHLTNYT